MVKNCGGEFHKEAVGGDPGEHISGLYHNKIRARRETSSPLLPVYKDHFLIVGIILRYNFLCTLFKKIMLPKVYTQKKKKKK